ncbi:MFS transporter [Carboxylicivirga caseinilyticus]|uniref:MFS transporter n=1 Tax=Carboxylicivirga caseinilyticus TaxID=3417572 RepID=UPI003D333DDA|nr:MFS transporter [Marinilabiliaceae bacterium A049]
MNLHQDKISKIEKIGYSLGDLAANLIFQTLMTFLAFFYTDVYQISPSWSSIIIFVGGITGSLFNPLMGIIADRTRTRWGKFRPWLLWTSIPLGVVGILAFSTPDFSDTGKVIYAMSTYILLMAVYASNNVPYTSLSGVITGNMSERNSITSYRFVAVMVAQFIIQVLLLPLVLIMGDGDKAQGFHEIFILFACAGSIMFLIAFFTTKERIAPSAKQKSSIKTDVKDVFKNKPWISMLIAIVLLFVAMGIRNGSNVYYFSYYLDEGQLSIFLNGLGFYGFIEWLDRVSKAMGFIGFNWPEDTSTTAFSLYSAVSILFKLTGIVISKRLADKYGKRNIFGISLFFSALFLSAYYFYSPKAIVLVFVTQAFYGLSIGLLMPLLWAMVADVVDYSEWKTRRRATATVFSITSLGFKVGLSIGGSLVAGILFLYGYDVDMDHSMKVQNGVKMLISIYPALASFIGVISLYFYEINKKMEQQIENDLRLRRLNDE